MRRPVWAWLSLVVLASCCQGGDSSDGPPGPNTQEDASLGERVWDLEDVDRMLLEDSPPESHSDPVLTGVLRGVRAGLKKNNRHRPLPGQTILPLAWSGVTILDCDGYTFTYRPNCSGGAEVIEERLPTHREDRTFAVECAEELVPARIELLDLGADPETEPTYARRAKLLAAWLEKVN